MNTQKPASSVASKILPVSAEKMPGDEDVLHPRPSGFWLQTWVQNVLPWVTSFSIHAAIIILGLLIWGVAKAVAAKPPEQQPIMSEGNFQEGPPGGILNVGPNAGDINRPFMQPDEIAQATPKGFANSNKSLEISLAGGNESDSSAAVFDRGIASLGGPGRVGIGSLGGGGVAMIGPPGGGGLGVKSPLFNPTGHGDGNARRFVFLCDGTGSMLNKMATLKEELSKVVGGLTPMQSFDILFFQGNTVAQFSKQSAGSSQLIWGTPNAKRKASNFLESVNAEDTTNPIPALEAALNLHPDILYFLTDAADFPDTKAVLESINRLNKDRSIHINTILFVEDRTEHERNQESEVLMKQIATENGGKFRWVEMDAISR